MSWQDLCTRSLKEVSLQDLCKGVGKISTDIYAMYLNKISSWNLCTSSLEEFSCQDLCKRPLGKISAQDFYAVSLYKISIAKSSKAFPRSFQAIAKRFWRAPAKDDLQYEAFWQHLCIFSEGSGKISVTDLDAKSPSQVPWQDLCTKISGLCTRSMQGPFGEISVEDGWQDLLERLSHLAHLSYLSHLAHLSHLSHLSYLSNLSNLFHLSICLSVC